jgi:hypothetical protein
MAPHDSSALRAALLVAVLTCVVAKTTSAQSPSDLQLGLRLDAESSMQWAGNRIYLEGKSHDIVETTAKTIHDIWPGSVPGSFSIVFDRSVGMLIGKGIVSAGPLFGEGALLRSSRYDIVYGAQQSKRPDGKIDTRFVEWRSVKVHRDLATIPGTIVDFDADVRGVLLYLTADRRIFLLTEPQGRGTEIVPPKNFVASPARVFVDADASEVLVLGGNQVARLRRGEQSWMVRPFDVRKQALVRHAVSRRMLIEDRFTP